MPTRAPSRELKKARKKFTFKVNKIILINNAKVTFLCTDSYQFFDMMWNLA